MKTDSTLERLAKSQFGISCNANDTFWYASAAVFTLDPGDWCNGIL